MRASRRILVALAAVTLTASLLAQRHAALSEAETEKVRNTQDPAQRIKLYLEFMQKRLAEFENYRQQPINPRVRMGKFLNEVLGQYVDLDDEMKDWIQYQYNHEGDMRRGLRSLLNHGAQQLAQLRHVQHTPDPYASHYSDTLNNAIADMEDTLNGATQALQHQIKEFGMLQRHTKAARQASNTAVKEEKKRLKEEKKLREKERKQRKSENN